MITITRQQARQFILAKQGLIGSYRFAGVNDCDSVSKVPAL